MLESPFFELKNSIFSVQSTRPKGHVTCLYDVSLRDSQQNMAESKRKPVKKGGRYCVVGTPNGESCTNTQYAPGISTHLFPLEPNVRAQLNLFVDIVLILVSQSANLHLCVQLVLSRVPLPTPWLFHCQEWKELK